MLKKITIRKTIEYGLYFLAFLLTIQTRLIIRPGSINDGYLEYLTISLYVVDLIALFLVLLFIFDQFKFIENISKFSRFWWLLTGLDCIIFVSLFFADDKFLAIYKYGLFILGVGIFWILTRAHYDKIKLLISFLLGLLFQAFLGIWQFLSQSSFTSKWLGLASHDPRDLGVSVIEAFGSDSRGERWLRAYGGLDHPNILGGVLAIGILLSLFLYLNNKKNKIYNYFYLISYSILLLALIFTFSRSAWLAVFIAMMIIFLSLIIKKDWKKLRAVFEVFAISLVLFLVVFFSYKNLFLTRFSFDSRLENKSYTERVSSINESKDIIKNNFWGVGIGSYSLALADKVPDQKSWYYQPVHNNFLLVLAEIGLFGFLVFVGILIYIFREFILEKNYFHLAILASLIILMMFEHWWWSVHFGILFFWFIIGVLYKDNVK